MDLDRPAPSGSLLPLGTDESLQGRDLVDRLRSLVVGRDMSVGTSRAPEAQKGLDDFLRETGVRRRRGRPSPPHLAEVVRGLAKEAQRWLGLVDLCLDQEISSHALAALTWWPLGAEADLTVAQLAFPTVPKSELEFIGQRAQRTIEGKRRGKLEPEPPELTIVYVLHRRVEAYIPKLTTVADYAFGEPFVTRTSTAALESNPLPAD